jgi:hypothetical protein
MKANKALKRLAKIEEWMSDVMERYSGSAPHIRAVLQDAKAAVIRAKEAVSLQSSSGTTKNPPLKHSSPPSKADTKSAEEKAATKKAAVKVPPAKAAMTTARLHKPPRKPPLGKKAVGSLRSQGDPN